MCEFGASLHNGSYEYGHHFCNHFQLTPRQRLTPVQISDTLTNSISRYIIPPGVANLVFDVPKHARGIKEAKGWVDPRHTESLFEIKC